MKEIVSLITNITGDERLKMKQKDEKTNKSLIDPKWLKDQTQKRLAKLDEEENTLFDTLYAGFEIYQRDILGFLTISSKEQIKQWEQFKKLIIDRVEAKENKKEG